MTHYPSRWHPSSEGYGVYRLAAVPLVSASAVCSWLRSQVARHEVDKCPQFRRWMPARWPEYVQGADATEKGAQYRTQLSIGKLAMDGEDRCVHEAEPSLCQPDQWLHGACDGRRGRFNFELNAVAAQLPALEFSAG